MGDLWLKQVWVEGGGEEFSQKVELRAAERVTGNNLELRGESRLEI